MKQPLNERFSPQIPVDHLEWSQLSEEQKSAAIVLGYDTDKWNDDSSSSSEATTAAGTDVVSSKPGTVTK